MHLVDAIALIAPDEWQRSDALLCEVMPQGPKTDAKERFVCIGDAVLVLLQEQYIAGLRHALAVQKINEEQYEVAADYFIERIRAARRIRETLLQAMLRAGSAGEFPGAIYLWDHIPVEFTPSHWQFIYDHGVGLLDRSVDLMCSSLVAR